MKLTCRLSYRCLHVDKHVNLQKIEQQFWRYALIEPHERILATEVKLVILSFSTLFFYNFRNILYTNIEMGICQI